MLERSVGIAGKAPSSGLQRRRPAVSGGGGAPAISALANWWRNSEVKDDWNFINSSTAATAILSPSGAATFRMTGDGGGSYPIGLSRRFQWRAKDLAVGVLSFELKAEVSPWVALQVFDNTYGSTWSYYNMVDNVWGTVDSHHDWSQTTVLADGWVRFVLRHAGHRSISSQPSINIKASTGDGVQSYAGTIPRLLFGACSWNPIATVLPAYQKQESALKGDSLIVVGYGDGHAEGVLATSGFNSPIFQTVARLADLNAVGANTAQFGAAFNVISANAQFDIYQLRRHLGKPVVVLLWNAYQSGLLAQYEAFADLVHNVSGAFKVIPITTLPIGGETSGDIATRQALNASLIASTHFDGVVNLDGIANLQNNANDTYYQAGDTRFPTLLAVQTLIAPAIEPVVRAALAEYGTGVIGSDTFAGAAVNSSVNNGWIATDGIKWSTTTGHGSMDRTGTGLAAPNSGVSGEIMFRDTVMLDVLAEVDIITTATPGVQGLAVRLEGSAVGTADAGNDHIFIQLNSWSEDHVVQIYERIGGAYNLKATSATDVFLDNATHRVGLQVIGNEVKAFIDGVEVATAVATGLALGWKHGIRPTNLGTDWRYDNFKLYDRTA